MVRAALLGRPIIYKVEIEYGTISVKTMPLTMGRGARIQNCLVWLPRAGVVVARKDSCLENIEGNAITGVIRK